MVSLLPDNLDFSRPRCTVHESTLAGARALVVDNGIFKLAILPEFGGRLCSLFYRPFNRELLATEFINGPRGTFNVRGGWCAAFPSLLADGEAISRVPWEAEITEQNDERVTIRLSCHVDRISHMVDGQVRVTPGTILVERFIRLVAGEPAITVEDVLTNRNVWPMSTTWSAVVSLRAAAGDRAVLPVEGVEVQRGVGPTGNELDFGLLVTTPYQALARNLREGWLGFRPSSTPADVRISFPRALLPHTLIVANRDDRHPAQDVFRLQLMATPGPIAEDSRDGALVLPPKQPVSIPIRLEVGNNIISTGAWSRPGLQLAELITGQHVPNGRLAIWRIGEIAVALKTSRYLALLMPEFSDDALLTPDDLPAADLILCSGTPPRAVLRTLVQRTSARFVGPSALRQALLTDGVGEDRSIALSPGARFDLPGLGILATPARNAQPAEQLGFLIQADHLLLYHAGPTEFLGEFGPIGQQFHPQLVCLPLDSGITMTDAVHAAKLLQPRMVLPLGSEVSAQDFTQRCRNQHVPFAVQSLHRAEGALFDGWRFNPMS